MPSECHWAWQRRVAIPAASVQAHLANSTVRPTREVACFRASSRKPTQKADANVSSASFRVDQVAGSAKFPMLRAGLGGDNSVYGSIELGGRSGQTRALCGEPRPAIRQTASSNL